MVGRVENDKQNKAQWLCRCDCGTKTKVRGYHLRRGDIVSCGCKRKTQNLKHGKSNHKLFSVWWDMKRRCYNKSRSDYIYYGGRGIKVCDIWKDDFQAFYDWAKASGYEEGLTLDRIDNDKGYQPSNCRWVPMKVQNNNKRNNVIITIDEESKTAKEWSREANIPYMAIMSRIYRETDNVEELIKEYL